MAIRSSLAIDKTIELTINGSQQRIRMCAEREGLPPLLIVQGGPALPMLHEVAKYRRLMNLEADFLVAYWEQRGCGKAARKDAMSVSVAQQVDDLRAVLRWLHSETKQRAIVLGISIGATFALLAADHERDQVKSIVAVSPDSHTASSDAYAHEFLQEQARRSTNEGLRRKIAKLGPPPYLDVTGFQRRARLLADLDTIEHGRTFGALVREMLFAMLRTYGVIGSIVALRNMNLVLRNLLADIASLDLIAEPPRVAVPVHYVFGAKDALTPLSAVKEFPALVAAPSSTVVRVADGGHMVHFDHPDVVRSIAAGA